MNDILSERGACGVGFVANLKNVPSFNIVRDALTALGCMEHRGGCGADNDSGDGAGLMSAIPWDLFDDWANKQGLAPFDRKNTGVGMVFLPQDEKSMEEAKAGNVLPQYAARTGTHFFLSPMWDISIFFLDQRFLPGIPCSVTAYFNCYMWNFHAAILCMPTKCWVLKFEPFCWNVVSVAHYFPLIPESM